MDPLAELFLYLADRCQHVSEKIQPAFSQGHWVISDRFWDATVVYQGLARGLNLKLPESIASLNSWVPFGRTRPSCWTCPCPSAWPGPGSGSTAQKNQKRNPVLKKRPGPFMKKSAKAICPWPAKNRTH